MFTRLSALALTLCLMFAVGCQSTGDAHGSKSKSGGVDSAVAVIYPTQGNNVYGLVMFTRQGSQVRVNADVRGLDPGSTHAIHIHQYGDLTAPDGTSAGGHYNPENVDHALPEQAKRHAGDLGNLQANDQGIARKQMTVDNITIDGKWHSVLGRAVIVHAGEDDGGQPTGNAGGRIGFGVIGIANTGN